MEQLNRVELRGVVGGVRTQKVGDRLVAHLALATNYAYKDKAGSPVIETTWHNVVAWEGRDIADVDQIKKGDKLYVVGRFRTQKYTDSNEQEKISFEVNATRVVPVLCEEPLQYEMQ